MKLFELYLPPEVDKRTVPETAQNLILVHGSGNPNMTLQNIEIVRTSGQKQGKKGRVYGGFYTTSLKDADQASAYARSTEGGAPTMYKIKIKNGVKIFQTKGDVTRIGEQMIKDMLEAGYGILVGKDPRGYTEWVVLDKAAIQSIDAEKLV